MKKLENGEYDITAAEYTRWTEFASIIYTRRGRDKELLRIDQAKQFIIEATLQGNRLTYRFNPKSRQARVHAAEDFVNVVIPRKVEGD